MTNDVNETIILDKTLAAGADIYDDQLGIVEQQLADQTTLARHLGEKVAAADKRLADINAALESLLNPLIVAAVDEYMSQSLDDAVQERCDDWVNNSFDITSFEYEIKDMAGEAARDEISDSDVVQQLEIRELVSDILSGAKITGTVEID
jgi:hypothetical protein|tara:strand:+ start:547 stop:996 length:450 start_codon:yes stop_codon:yes gene_type:complete